MIDPSLSLQANAAFTTKSQGREKRVISCLSRGIILFKYFYYLCDNSSSFSWTRARIVDLLISRLELESSSPKFYRNVIGCVLTVYRLVRKLSSKLLSVLYVAVEEQEEALCVCVYKRFNRSITVRKGREKEREKFITPR